jgi:hypothetical protein
MSKPIMGKPQETLVIQHLFKSQTISGLEAYALYKIRSLPRRILTLRQEGYKIKSIHMKDQTGQRYVRYQLQGKY